MREKILIHALGATMGGALRHLTNFLPELCNHDTSREYVVLVRESFPALTFQENIRIERLADSKASGWITRIIHDVIEVPIKLRRERFDIVVSLTNFGPIWTSIPHIIFQRNSLYYCNYYLEQITGKQKFETFMRRRWAIEAMKRADLIVTPSNSMTNMIRKTCPEMKYSKFSTIYHGFERKSLNQDMLCDTYIQSLSDTRIRLLYPTHPAPYKGFDVLFKMLAHLKKTRSDFVLFAPISYDDWPDGIREYEEQIAYLGIQEHVILLGRVPQSQMGHLYEKVDLMVYPSLCESFGFSMIEAMHYGLPVVAAGTDVNREICGNGAIYYSPRDYKSGAEMINIALEHKFREQLAAAGRERVQSYDWSWARYAKEFVGLIETVV